MAREERLDNENREMVDHDLHFGYARYVTDVGMRELRQNPAPVLREVEGGAEVTVLVNGRAVARIVPLETPAWVAGERAERIYGTIGDPGWEDELRAARTEDFVDDPWE
jgi:prevent-host-death family protein